MGETALRMCGGKDSFEIFNSKGGAAHTVCTPLPLLESIVVVEAMQWDFLREFTIYIYIYHLFFFVYTHIYSPSVYDAKCIKREKNQRSLRYKHENSSAVRLRRTRFCFFHIRRVDNHRNRKIVDVAHDDDDDDDKTRLFGAKRRDKIRIKKKKICEYLLHARTSKIMNDNNQRFEWASETYFRDKLVVRFFLYYHLVLFHWRYNTTSDNWHKYKKKIGRKKNLPSFLLSADETSLHIRFVVSSSPAFVYSV